MWQERTIPLEWFDQIRWEEKDGGEKEREKKKEKKRRGERGFSFSLDFPMIGSSFVVRARGEVDPGNESYAWVPKSRSFIKLQEVGGFPTRFIFSLKAI